MSLAGLSSSGSHLAAGALWVDKYRPESFDSLDVHSGQNECLKSLANAEDLPHILLAGPHGSGKMTRVRALLRELYGPGVSRMKMEDKVFLTPSSRKVEMTIFGSSYHVEMCPGDVGIYDRVVVQEIIKEIAQSPPIDRSKHSFKTVVILEAERLTKDAQQALRRTMEKYSSNMRLIMCCSSTSRIIAPIRSRCMIIRIPSPTDLEVSAVLKRVARFQSIDSPDQLISSVISISKGNMRRALLSFEAAVAKGQEEASLPDWELCVVSAVDQIFKEQSPNSLLATRSLFYELLTHCIPANIIMDSMLPHILSRIVDTNAGTAVLEASAFYDHRASRGVKAILHLEAFAAKVMSILVESSKRN